LRKLCPSKDLLVKNDPKKKQTSNTSELKRVYLLTYNHYSPITKPGYLLLWTSFVLIIKIGESLNNEHLQNNRSVLNTWPTSSQNLGLQINNYGIKSSYSPNLPKFVGAAVGMTNPLQVYGRSNGHEISWTLITKRHNNTFGCGFFCIVITKKRELSTTIVTKKKKLVF
jgi:hypothetical protein